MGNIASTKEELKEKLDLMDKYYQEQIVENMSADIESVRIMARDSVNAKEKDMKE